MHPSRLYAVIFSLACFSNSFAQNTSTLVEVDLADADHSRFISASASGTAYIQYINAKAEMNSGFRLRFLAPENAAAVTLTRSPESATYRMVLRNAVTSYAGEEITINLNAHESVAYEVKVVRMETVNSSSVSVEYKYLISISTEDTYRPNSSFIFISAIRSVAGEAQPNEFFDLNLKFNYLKRMFTLFGLDLQLAPADSGQVRITEGMLTANWFVNSQQMLRSGDINRAFFLGGGLKIFNQYPYMGVHCGSIEINGPLFTSYGLVGFYRNAYAGYATQALDGPVNFRNNVYAEFALAFDNKKSIAAILSDIRIKLGMLFPFTDSDNDTVKTQAKDVQYRLVLEVPIGGIYKF